MMMLHLERWLTIYRAFHTLEVSRRMRQRDVIESWSRSIWGAHELALPNPASARRSRECANFLKISCTTFSQFTLLYTKLWI